MQTPPAGAGASPIDGPYAWFRLGVSMLLATVGSVGMWSVVVVLPTIPTEFGVDRAGASVPYTMTMIGFAFGNVIIGRYVDRLGITLPLIAAACTLATGFTLAAMTTALWQFALIQGLLIGIGTSASFGPMIADLSHWFRRRRGIAVAAAATGNYLAGAVWPPILQGFIESDGWRATYTGVGLFCIAVMIPLALLLRPRPPKDAHALNTNGANGLREIGTMNLRPRTLQMTLAVAGVACCVAMSMPQVHLVAYSKDLGYGAARGAEMLSFMFAGGVITRLATGVLADYIGGVRTLLLGSVMQCAALLLYLPFDGMTSLYVISMLFGLSQGGIVPMYAVIVREYLPAHEAGQRIGLVIMSTVLGMALGGWLSGWIYDLTGSYQVAFINGVAWNLLNISIVAMLLWRTQGPRTVTA
jgi:MFS family permease